MKVSQVNQLIFQYLISNDTICPERDNEKVIKESKDIEEDTKTLVCALEQLSKDGLLSKFSPNEKINNNLKVTYILNNPIDFNISSVDISAECATQISSILNNFSEITGTKIECNALEIKETDIQYLLEIINILVGRIQLLETEIEKHSDKNKKD
jgi:hypothetical protein